MRSLSARLSGSLIIALVVLTALVLGALHFSLQRLTETFVLARLQHDIDGVLTALYFDPDRQLHVRSERLNPFYRQPYSGHYFVIHANRQTLRSRSLWDSELQLPAGYVPAAGAVFTSGPDHQILLVAGRAVTLQNQPLQVIVAEDYTPLSRGLRRLMLELVLVALLVLAALLVAQYLIVRSGLRPLRTIGGDIQRLSRGEIRQLDAATTALEIRPLVAEINRLLATLEQRVQRSRHALGNLAHALKTPLAVLVQLAEQTPDEYGAALRQQTRTIRTLIERELKRARIAGPASPGQRVLLSTEVADLLATLRRIYRDKPLDLQTRIARDEIFPGDRDDLLELLGNLLDNACQWACRVVRLSATSGTGGVELVVEDDGPGCPPAQLERLTRRGVRLDEQQHGHGLGLAIVADIVEQYGGELAFDRAPALGGLRVRVHLPWPLER